MTVPAGTLIGRYKIGPLVGAGGMGEVYRARDTQLGRDVALKVLPDTYAADAEALERFEAEARATAALNHPGIVSVYDVGVQDRRPYLVTELLQGVTLRTRMGSGPLDFATASRFAREIAVALADAHAKGIVHRDIKPENLFVTSAGTIKILDFGLAKLTLPLSADSIADMTQHGTIRHGLLGTLGYMAPEQARGQPIDHRADIFSFGCVLFEMLHGCPAFVRETPADTISAILTEPPPELTTSPERQISPSLARVLRRCLEKDPAARFQSTSDLAFALGSFAGETDAPVQDVPPKAAAAPPRRRLAWLLGGVTALAAAAAAVIWLVGKSSSASRDAIEFLVPTPGEELSFASAPLPGLDPTAPQMGISPDGRTVAFVTAHPSGQRRLWVRSLDAATPRVVEGSEGVSSWPFWSPDSRYLVFATHGALWKADVTAHAVERLCTLADQGAAISFVTGAWDDGKVVFSVGPDSLFRVSALGGDPERFTTLDKKRGDQYHSWPQILGKRFLAFVRTDDAKTTGTYAGTLDSAQLTPVLPTASRAVYASGHLLWTIDDRLVAQPFDPRTLTLSGTPSMIVPSVFRGAGRTSAFAVSGTGHLVYAIGGTALRQFTWRSRTGAPIGDVGTPGAYGSFDLSGDGSQVVAELRKERPATRSTLVLLDTRRDVVTALTTGELNDTDPRFGASGDVAFARNTGARPGIAHIERAGTEPSILMARGPAEVVWLEDWAGDKGGVIYRSSLNPDAWQILPDRPPRRLTHTREPVEQVQRSPDGRWMVYNNADSGRAEVYLSSIATGERWQLSDAGGVQATWRGDGAEVYFLGLDGGMYVVDVRDRNGAPEASKPRLLFRTRLPVISAVVEQYRVTHDGERFLLCMPLTSVQQEPLRVLVNWPAKLSR